MNAAENVTGLLGDTPLDDVFSVVTGRLAKTLRSGPEYEDSTIVVVLPDTGERYLSTDRFTPME